MCLALAGERRSLYRSGFSNRRDSAERASTAATTDDADGLSRIRSRPADPNRLRGRSDDDCERKRRCMGIGSATPFNRSEKCPALSTRAG